jgi:hypothetical protein
VHNKLYKVGNFVAGETKERTVVFVDFSSRSAVVAVIWAENDKVRVYL